MCGVGECSYKIRKKELGVPGADAVGNHLHGGVIAASSMRTALPAHTHAKKLKVDARRFYS